MQQTTEQGEKSKVSILNLVVLVVDIGLVHALGVRGVDVLGHEALADGASLARRSKGVHHVDLLEGETLGLGDEEVGEEEASQASGTPDEEDLHLETSRAGLLVDEVRS